MRKAFLILKYYLIGRPVATVCAIAFIAFMFAYPTITKDIRPEPTLQELQMRIKLQIDNANKSIVGQQSYADQKIHEAEETIANLTACKQANQVLKDNNSSLTIESFSKGSQPSMAIDCHTYKVKDLKGGDVESNTGSNVNASLPPKINKNPLTPSQLYLTTPALDKCYVSQTPSQHFIDNKRFAFDIACTFNTGKVQQFIAYAPDYRNISRTYKVIKKYNDKLTGDTLELGFKENDSDMKWVIGHVQSTLKEGDDIRTGEVIGQTNLSGYTTGYHNHIELWMNGVNIDYTTRSQVIENKRYNKMQAWSWGDQVYFTHYTLGDTSQNDKSPCIGASGVNSCDLMRNGIQSIALTVDVRRSLGIKFGNTIAIAGPCGGQYQVHDEKNERYRYSCIKESGACNKGDIATQIGHRDSNGNLVIDFTGVPNCNGGVHTLIKKV